MVGVIAMDMKLLELVLFLLPLRYPVYNMYSVCGIQYIG